MGYGRMYIGIALTVFFIILDAVIYSFRAAIENINIGSVEEKKESGSKNAAILLKILETPVKISDTINIVVFITNIIAGSYILGAFTRIITREMNSNNPWIYIAVAFLMIVIFLVLGVIIPEKFGKRRPEKIAFKYVRIMRVIMVFFSPVAFITTEVSRLILAICGVKQRDDDDNVTEEEIITMVNEGQEQGVLEAGEAEMITNIFELGDKKAGDIMIHRSNIVAVDDSITLDEFIQKHIEGKYSRFPVYEGDIDNIVGTIHIRDALILYRNIPNRKKKIKTIKGLLRKPFMVPDSIDIDELLKDMQEVKIHMGIVVDEYGQTAGIVTLEDIIEEIVGNILDEYDEDEEAVEYAGDDTYVVDGLTEIEDINKLLRIKIESDDFETLNGFLISKLGRIADENEKEIIEDFGYEFRILEVTGNVIRKVEITKKENKEEGTQNE